MNLFVMQMKTIAHVRTCYGEKFGVPRQPGLVAEAWGQLVLEPEFRNPDILRGLDGFSHLWLVFAFHKTGENEWNPTVRPPRLGGNKKVGVFASRSPFRPNPIGLSCVRLDQIDFDHADGPVLHLRGIDLVDGTPVLDIKPYVPYSDSIPGAQEGFAAGPPEKLDVHWQENTGKNIPEQTRILIETSLSIDPRPAYRRNPNQQDDREYGCLIEGLNVRWKVTSSGVLVLSCDAAG